MQLASQCIYHYLEDIIPILKFPLDKPYGFIIRRMLL